MADVKDGDIVFEYPDDDDEIPGTKLPDEKEVKVSAEKNEVKVETKAEDFDLEIEDDTPSQDKGKEPLPKNIVEELENDNLEEYSDRVKTRMAQLRKVYHDERREKESADRERQEAVRFAQQISEENKKLKSTLSSGELTYIETLKGSIEQQLHSAKRDYREAYDSGDTDKVMDAQERLTQATLKADKVKNFKPTPLQEEKPVVQTAPEPTPQYRPDTSAQAWQQQNPWFGEDEEMTSLALGLHEKLRREGVQVSSQEYYRKIDATIRRRFPEKFEEEAEQNERPVARKSSVVAPATRTTSPKRVRLNPSELSLAKKLNLTPEQYAKAKIEMEANNG